MNQRLHQPVLKWAGGKTKLMPFIRTHFPRDEQRRWVEPFIGAGSVFLNMFATDALLSDSNPDLINFYRCVRERKVEFLSQVKLLAERTFTEPDYYALRTELNVSSDSLRRAVLFFALNRLGFNGLCRYNLAREYSVPWGHRAGFKVNAAKVDYLAFRLSGIELKQCDFEDALVDAGNQDQIYCDPPYDKITKSSFVSYDGKPFDQAAHIRLADRLVTAFQNGARVAISNSDTAFTRDLYEERGFKLHKLSVYRSISSHKETRQKADEILAVLE